MVTKRGGRDCGFVVVVHSTPDFGLWTLDRYLSHSITVSHTQSHPITPIGTPRKNGPTASFRVAERNGSGLLQRANWSQASLRPTRKVSGQVTRRGESGSPQTFSRASLKGSRGF